MARQLADRRKTIERGPENPALAAAEDFTAISGPPLAEQARFVSVLAKFGALTSSITEGLPRQIDLRQKQYEYYRDLLRLFFKPASPNNAAENAEKR